MPELTYGRLNDALRNLGFTVAVFEGDTYVLKHAKTGALVTYPKFPDAQPVYAHHAAGARVTLATYGIPLPPELAGQLQAG